ncbi:MAG TPA: hypothetical protein VGZ00_08485, partial [Candidatus Baltobacteraceae bacterium]|nr:hypothetical protein [Candidatus Baltobacteraceae bacterium]
RIIGSNKNLGIDIGYACTHIAKDTIDSWFTSGRVVDHSNGKSAECKNIVADAIRDVFRNGGSIFTTIEREERSIPHAPRWSNLEHAIKFARANEIVKSVRFSPRSEDIVRTAYAAAMVLAFAYGDDEKVQKWFATPNVNLYGLGGFGKSRTPVEAFRALQDLPEMFRKPEELVMVAIEDVASDLSGVPRNRKYERARSSRACSL